MLSTQECRRVQVDSVMAVCPQFDVRRFRTIFFVAYVRLSVVLGGGSLIFQQRSRGPSAGPLKYVGHGHKIHLPGSPSVIIVTLKGGITIHLLIIKDRQGILNTVAESCSSPMEFPYTVWFCIIAFPTMLAQVDCPPCTARYLIIGVYVARPPTLACEHLPRSVLRAAVGPNQSCDA